MHANGVVDSTVCDPFHVVLDERGIDPADVLMRDLLGTLVVVLTHDEIPPRAHTDVVRTRKHRAVYNLQLQRKRGSSGIEEKDLTATCQTSRRSRKPDAFTPETQPLPTTEARGSRFSRLGPAGLVFRLRILDIDPLNLLQCLKI